MSEQKSRSISIEARLGTAAAIIVSVGVLFTAAVWLLGTTFTKNTVHKSDVRSLQASDRKIETEFKKADELIGDKIVTAEKEVIGIKKDIEQILRATRRIERKLQ